MYITEKRTVSDADWFNPYTWGQSHEEYRRVWDMDTPLPPSEVELFVKDDPNYYTGESKWRRVEPQ